jgi:hypothetical protein
MPQSFVVSNLEMSSFFTSSPEVVAVKHDIQLDLLFAV